MCYIGIELTAEREEKGRDRAKMGKPVKRRKGSADINDG